MLSAFAGGQLFGERSGSGKPRVLALHGWAKSHADLGGVTEGFDAIALDLPGFGASPAPAEPWGAREYAEGIAGVLDEMNAPVVVVGHSLGGRIAVNLAEQRPESIGALVLVGAPLIRRRSSLKTPVAFRLAKLANRIGILSDERMEAERRKRGSADYRAATGVMRDILVKIVNESYEEILKKVTCPVELVWGEHDTEAPLEQAQIALQLLERGKLTVVPGGGHWLPQQNPQVIREAIKRCL